ncbi:MAG: DUF3987 domain-containing protein [Deltaproteobacteria bacterium]|nr:DUF3987 domain-containing protein [Deltaproteobacteria bacterium]
MNDHIEQFTQAMRNARLDPAEVPTADGTFHRFQDRQDKAGKKNGWYVLHVDALPAGMFGHWSLLPDGQRWQSKPDNTLTPKERNQIRERIEQLRTDRDKARDEVRSFCRNKAEKMLEAAHEVNADHPYLFKKNIKPYGAKQLKDMLIIPVRKGKTLTGLQIIMPDGSKKFLTGTEKAGAYLVINGKGKTVYLIEGWATGCTIHELTGATVIICYDCQNLEAVASEIRLKGPDYDMVLVADNDRMTDGNPGLTKARAAALATGARLAIPTFPGDDGTDANDLHAISGKEAILSCLKKAVLVTPTEAPAPGTATTTEPPAEEWPKPSPIESKINPEPYPLDALPDTIRLAIEEVLGFVKAPVPLVVSAALSALSMAVQSHADVARAEKLTGPSSTYLLTIADSGERKSTCDGFFTSAIRDYEEKQAEAAKPFVKEYEAAFSTWDMKYSGVKDSIRAAAKAAQSTEALETDLSQLQLDKPEPPRIPRIIYGDATPAALKYSLAKGWPSGAVVSSEGGIVFGGHGMKKDSAMENLATLNQLWDGTDMPTERRASESYTVKGARFTMSIMVQEPTLRAFFRQDGGLARGTGFLARFLIAWPESTQGFRPFTEAPANWPSLAAFNHRISVILNQVPPIDDDGALHPAMLTLAPDAKAAWVAFHDAIESMLASGGELFDIRDVASKTADNAARLACQFHVFSGDVGAISLDAFESASRITAWHLNEARRFFMGLALPQELADAARLDEWMLGYCRQHKSAGIPTTTIQRFGPCGLRSKVAIDAAMEELEGLERSRRVKDGKRKTIHINPALLRGE